MESVFGFKIYLQIANVYATFSSDSRDAFGQLLLTISEHHVMLLSLEILSFNLRNMFLTFADDFHLTISLAVDFVLIHGKLFSPKIPKLLNEPGSQ